MSKKQGDQIQFSPEKKTRKREVDSSFLSKPSNQWMDCVKKVVDLSVLQEFFLKTLKSFIMQWRNN